MIRSAILCVPMLALAAGEVRIGDAEMTGVAELDRYYPQTEAWASAGVAGGIPAADSIATVAELSPGDDIQAAIDAVGEAGGAVLLGEGEWELRAPLRMAGSVVLRGAGERTVLRYGGERGSQTAVIFDGVEGAGLEHLVLRYADPHGWGDGERLLDAAYRNAEGFVPPEHAALVLRGSGDCFLGDLRMTPTPSDPLAVSGCAGITLRACHVEGALNHGVGQGRIVMADCEGLLVVGLIAYDLRQIRLAGPLRDSVFKGCALGAGFKFANESAITRNLFEDCHFIFPAGYPYRPFAKGVEPLGPDSLVMNCSAYHHGTDAVVSGVLMEDGIAYALQPTAIRGRFDPLTKGYRPARLVKRHQTRTDAPRVDRDTDEAVAVPAAFDAVPDGVAAVSLEPRLRLHEWTFSGPLPASVWEADLAELIAEPVTPGATRSLAGSEVEFAALSGEVKIPAEPLDPLHVQKIEAKFGIRPPQPKGASIDLLAAVGGDWKAGAVFQCVFAIHEPVVLEPDWQRVGFRWRVWCSNTTMDEDHRYRLEPGVHPLTLQVDLERKPPFIKEARMKMEFGVHHETAAAGTILVDTPKPEEGSLYPYRGFADPLAGARAGIDAWFAYFETLREPDVPGIREVAAGIHGRHSASPAGRAAARVLRILDRAPHDETAGELNARAWGELGDYYELAGMPERKWAIGKAGRGAKVRVYYPDAEVP